MGAFAASFVIPITALDKTAAGVRSVNRRFSTIVKPVSDLGKSWSGLKKEFGDNPAVKAMGKVGKAAMSMGKMASKFIPEAGEAVGAIETIGVAGAALGGLGLAAVGAIVGIGMLEMKVAKFGFQLKQTSLDLGESTQQVQSWRGAASLMGVDAKTVDSSMQQLGDTMQDATMGRNQSALMFMRRLGITMKRTSTGAVDVSDGMLQIADTIKRFNGNPEVQRMIARQFGVEGMLPVLRGGSAALKQNLKDQKKWALTDAQVDKANRYNLAINKLKANMKGMAVDFGAGTLDVTKWLWDITSDASILGAVSALWNGIVGLIAGGVNKLKGIAAGVANTAGGVAKGAADAYSRFTGATGAKRDNAKSIMGYLRQSGFTPAQAAGITAGMWAESNGLDPNAKNPYSSAAGLGQWLKKRQADFAKLYGHSLARSTQDEQLRFMRWEWDHTERGAGSALHGAQTAQQAMDAYVNRYMRPGAGAAGDLRRGGGLLDQFMQMQTPAGGVKVDVTVKHDGHAAVVKTKSTGGVTARARVEHSMHSIAA